MLPESEVVQVENDRSHEHVKTGVQYRNNEAGRALELALEQGSISWTEEEERRLVWKLDLLIIPLFPAQAFASGTLTFADSATYGVAAIFGLVEDLHLYDVKSLSPLVISTTKYSWSSSIPVLATLITLLPILSVVQRFPLGKAYSAFVLWSGVFALMMLALHHYAGTLVVRFGF
ncbi:hypothetical protein BDV12DRAFT_195345 [Aspergillus spectabilis]